MASNDLVGLYWTTSGPVEVHAGREWLQLSWHIDAADWRPSANPREGSNLVTYLIGALSRFEDVI